MSLFLINNNANTNLAGSITNIAVTANLLPGAGALFPSPGPGQYFVGSFRDAATRTLTEIVHVTNVTGDQITMVRAQEGTTALAWSAGDLFGNLITAGQLNSFAQNPQNLGGVVGATRGLTVTATGSTKTASLAAQEAVVETALGGTIYKGANIALTFDGTTTGPGGMDTGTLPNSATDVALYLIYNATTNTYALLGTDASVNGHGPIYGGTHMPSGYIASGLISSFVTATGTGNVPQLEQVGPTVFLPNANVLSSGAATTFTAIDCSSILPRAAKTTAGNATATSGADIQIAGNVNGIGFQSVAGSGSVGITGNFGAVPVLTSQQLFYRMTAASGSIAIDSYTI